MKWLVILLLPLLAGCSIYTTLDVDSYNFLIRPADWEYDYNDSFDFDTELDAFFAVSWVPYIADEGEDWQTPEETWNRNGGDCEDHAILFAYIAHKYFGKDYDMIFVGLNDGYHVLLTDGEYYYDPTWEIWRISPEFYVPHHIKTIWNYDSMMWVAVTDK